MNKYTLTRTHAQHEFTSGESSAVWQAALLLYALSPRCNALHCALLCHARACPCVMGSNNNNNNSNSFGNYCVCVAVRESRACAKSCSDCAHSLILSLFVCVCDL